MLLFQTPSAPDLVVGSPAPAITFQTADGRSLTLESLKGKVVVLTFTGYNCPACRTLEPKLAELAAKDRDVVFLDVSVDSPEFFPKLAALKAKDDPIKLVQDPYNTDRSKMGVWKYGNVATPTMFVIDRKGRMASLANQECVDGLTRLQYRIEWAQKLKD